MVQLLQLLPGGGAKALGQSVDVLGAELHGLVAQIYHVQRVRLPLGADVAEAGKRSDSDDVRIRQARNVAGEASVTAFLSVLGKGLREGYNNCISLCKWTARHIGERGVIQDGGCGWQN